MVSTCVITNSAGAGITLSAQDNAKLLHQLKSGFKTITNWNK